LVTYYAHYAEADVMWTLKEKVDELECKLQGIALSMCSQLTKFMRYSLYTGRSRRIRKGTV